MPPECPPCKIIICSGGAFAQMDAARAYLQAAIALVNPGNKFNYDPAAVPEVVEVMEEMEEEFKTCAEKMEKALKKLGRVAD